MSFRTLSTTLLQIFCSTISDSKVIVESIIDPDDNFSWKSLSIYGLTPISHRTRLMPVICMNSASLFHSKTCNCPKLEAVELQVRKQ